MADLVKFVLGDLFRFIGAVIILALLFDGLTAVIVALRGGKPKPLLARVVGGGDIPPDDAQDAEARP